MTYEYDPDTGTYFDPYEAEKLEHELEALGVPDDPTAATVARIAAVRARLYGEDYNELLRELGYYKKVVEEAAAAAAERAANPPPADDEHDDIPF